MQAPDPQDPSSDEPSLDGARAETGAVSSAFDPATGERLKRYVRIAAIVLVAGFIAVRIVRFVDQRSLAAEAARATQAPPVDIVTARAGAGSEELVLPGQTAAWYEATVYARVNGYVGQWQADIGDTVRKGQILATIETPELDAELAAARAQVGVAKAQQQAREAEAELSRTTNERWQNSPAGVVSEQEREEKKADFGSAVARRVAAEAQVSLDQARVDHYATLVEFKRVRAPFDGTVTERRIDIGNLVTAGSTAATTPLYKISQSDPLRVFVDVPQNVALQLRAGTPAEVRSTGGGALAITGKVARAAEALNAQARTMRVEVDVPNAAHRLLPGMYVNVAFAPPSHGLVAVPAAALSFRGGRTQVARIDAGSKVSFRDVTIARDDGATVLVSSGVSDGDRLVLNVNSQIEDGATVTVRSPASSADGAR